VGRERFRHDDGPSRSIAGWRAVSSDAMNRRDNNRNLARYTPSEVPQSPFGINRLRNTLSLLWVVGRKPMGMYRAERCSAMFPRGSSKIGAGRPRRFTPVGQTRGDLLQACIRLLDLLDAPAGISFFSNLIHREIVYRLLRYPQGDRLRAIARLDERAEEQRRGALQNGGGAVFPVATYYPRMR
jgi:hypothetical protein